VLFAKYNYNDEVKEDEMARRCSMHEGEEAWIQGFDGKPRRKETRKKTRCRQKDLIEIGWRGMDWSHLAQDRDQWWAVVNMVMSLQVHKMLGNS
jgi:hypothetical protein